VYEQEIDEEEMEGLTVDHFYVDFRHNFI